MLPLVRPLVRLVPPLHVFNSFSNAASKISIKRKKAPVWLFAIRGILEQAIIGLVDKGTFLELSTLGE